MKYLIILSFLFLSGFSLSDTSKDSETVVECLRKKNCVIADFSNTQSFRIKSVFCYSSCRKTFSKEVETYVGELDKLSFIYKNGQVGLYSTGSNPKAVAVFKMRGGGYFSSLDDFSSVSRFISVILDENGVVQKTSDGVIELGSYIGGF